MVSIKIGKHSFAVFCGRTTDTYSATIKKLALLQEKDFVQLVPARLVAGKKHLAAALEHSSTAFSQGTNFARRPELEFLVRLLGERQLHKVFKALEFGGEQLVLIVRETGKMTVSRIKEQLDFAEEKCCLGKDKKSIMEFYGVSETELEVVSDRKNPLEDLVVEKISLVEIEN